MHYVTSDLHGNGKLWDMIKNRIQAEDTLYFLGDAIDRGPDGLRIMRELLADVRVVYLKGNHEQFADDFLKVARAIEMWSDVPANVVGIWANNGGTKTMNDMWCDLTAEEMDQLYLQLKGLPYYVNVTVNGTQFRLSHAGYTPRYLEGILSEDRDTLLWDRDHFSDTWQDQDGENTVCLHGHTPVMYLHQTGDMVHFSHHMAPTLKVQPFEYAGGHKIDLDLCSAFTDKAALYCLETQTYEIIDINIE